jgi:hypothetical protein
MRRFERQMLRPVLEAIGTESVAAGRQNDEGGLLALRAVSVFIVWHRIADSKLSYSYSFGDILFSLIANIAA